MINFFRGVNMLKKYIYALYAIVVFISLIPSCVSTPQSTPHPLLIESEYRKLKTEAGDDWDIGIFENKITITSRRMFYFYIAVSLPYMNEDELKAYIMESGRKDYYVITLIFVPKWSKEKIIEARKTNDEIRLKQYGLAEKYGLTRLTPNKQNSFFPETPEDEEKIKRYDAEYAELESQLILIPDYENESYSIFRHSNEMGFEAAYNEEIPRLDLRKIFSSVN
jgi:hypothetical protein